MKVSARYPGKFALSIMFSLLLIVCWLFARTADEPQVTDIQNFIAQSQTCKTRSSNNQETFVAFITDRRMAMPLLSTLCNNNAIDRQYGKVQVHWSYNEQETIQYVGKGIADLALVKDNVMQAFATQSTHGYKVVAHYQDYATYLISRKDKPRLEKQYLWGKRLGLLDYPSSRSGHIVPKRLLIDIGMNTDDLQIVYANSHQALRDLLYAGEVDLISSYWQQADKERFSANYITPIDTNVSGSKWYLKMETENTDLLCEVQASLASLADETDSEYYSQLKLDPHCQLSSIAQGDSAS